MSLSPEAQKAYLAAVAELPPEEAEKMLAHLRLIANMSPSKVGDYAACPMQAVLDADYPRVEKPEFKCYSDFGKICHWQAQYMIGAATLDEKPPQAEWDSARTTPDVPGTPLNFQARVEQCATTAISVVQAATPLKPGAKWLSEVKAYSKEWLPQRIGRKGDNCGFGGSIDLVASDQSVLWDFKFVGAKKVPVENDINPRFRPDTGFQNVGNAGIKNTYVWQCGSYHTLTKIPQTNIVWVGRDGKTKSYVGMNWATERGAMFTASIKAFLTLVDSPGGLFRKMAWPVRAGHCDDCSHKDRCPAWMIGGAKSAEYKTVTANFGALEDLIRGSATGNAPQALPTPPTPPPPPAPGLPPGLPPPPPPPVIRNLPPPPNPMNFSL